MEEFTKEVKKDGEGVKEVKNGGVVHKSKERW